MPEIEGNWGRVFTRSGESTYFSDEISEIIEGRVLKETDKYLLMECQVSNLKMRVPIPWGIIVSAELFETQAEYMTFIAFQEAEESEVEE